MRSAEILVGVGVKQHQILSHPKTDQSHARDHDLCHLGALHLLDHGILHPLDHPYLQNPCPAPQGTSTEAVWAPLAISVPEWILPSEGNDSHGVPDRGSRSTQNEI